MLEARAPAILDYEVTLWLERRLRMVEQKVRRTLGLQDHGGCHTCLGIPTPDFINMTQIEDSSGSSHCYLEVSLT